MPHPRRSRFSLSNKIALGIVVLVAIAAFMFYSPDSLPLGDLRSIEIPGITGGSGDLEAVEKLTFTITSSENLFKERLDLRNVTVSAEGTHKSATAIGEAVFDNADIKADITFEGFEGRVDLGDTLLIDGTATSAISAGAKIKPKSDRFSVEAELSPTSYSVGPLDIQDLELDGVSGTIERLGKESSVIQLSDSSIEISNFDGTIVLKDGYYMLTGTALRVKGESFTLSS